MNNEIAIGRLDVKAFALAAESRAGNNALQSFKRLEQELPPGLAPDDAAALRVDWQARGQAVAQTGSGREIWLHLLVRTALPLTCQRCIGPVTVALEVDRAFRFVADEATALALDDESEEDLLVLSREFDLAELIEDELLMALPLVPRHDECPVQVKLSVADLEFETEDQAKPHPFAALAQLRPKK